MTAPLDEKTRIQKDIVMFEENIAELKKKKPHLTTDPRLSMATDYYHDSQFYFDKKDYFTAFGCINYGHGLLDALLKFDIQ